MSIKNLLKAKLRDFLGTIGSIFGTQIISGSEIPRISKRDYVEAYEKSNLIRKALGKIAQRCGTIDLELYRARLGKATEVEQHEILDLLKSPNPFMSGSDLFELTAIYETCLGDAYWWKAKDANGKVMQLWPLRSDFVSPQIGTDGTLEGYRYVSGSKNILFPLDEIVHFKLANPLSIFTGAGYMEGLMQTVLSDIFSQKWNAKFFFNSARPDGVLTTEAKATKKDRDDLARLWKDKFSGTENAHKVAVLSSGYHYEMVGETHKDMDFSVLRTMNQDDVLSTLGVPKSILGITEQVTRANAETGVYVFLSETIEPKFRKWVEKLNHSLVPDFDISLVFDFEDPTPEDEESLDNHHTAALNKWMTVNEIRDERGLDPVEGGDVLYIPLGIIPIGESSMASDKQTEDQSKSHEIPKGYVSMQSKALVTKKEKKLRRIYRDALRGNKTLQLMEDIISSTMERSMESISKMVESEKEKKEAKKEKWTKTQKKALWKIFDVRLTKWEIYWKATQEKMFENQRKRIKTQLAKSGIGKGVNKASKLDFIDWEKEKEIFEKRSEPMISEIVREAGEYAMNQVGKYLFDEKDKKTAEWILRKTVTFASDVNKTTKKRLKASLAEGLLNGEGIPELSKRVDEIMADRIASSAETIARTETLSASNAGTLFGYEQTGIVQKKEWLATLDGKTRDEHANADGEITELDGQFSVGGESLSYPGDPAGSASNIINCRCTILPVISE